MAMAAVAVGLSQFPVFARGGRYGLSLLLLGLAAGTFSFWGLSSLRGAWTLRTLYVWTGLVGTVAALRFWLVLGELYTVTQAKRIYKIIGAGSVLGAVAGSALARV